VWKVIKTKVQRNDEDLKTVVAEIWTSLQLHFIRSLYDSLPRRLQVVLRSRGLCFKDIVSIFYMYRRWPGMSSQNGRRHFNVCVPSREKIVFHTEINNKTYLKFCETLHFYGKSSVKFLSHSRVET
jgi:hypothetical protein